MQKDSIAVIEFGQKDTWPGLATSTGVVNVRVDVDKIEYPKGFNRLVFDPKFPMGLLYRSPKEGGRETFTYDGIEMEFVDYWPTDRKGNKLEVIRASYTQRKYGEYELIYIFIPIHAIPVDQLKPLELWQYLSEEMKKDLETRKVVAITQEKQEACQRMEHARKHRHSVTDPEYESVPDILVCTKCNGEQKIGRIQYSKRAAMKHLTVEEYGKAFVCLKCDPTQRGRKPTGKYLNMPKELHCHHEGCTFVQKQHPSATEKQAIAAGIPFNEFVDKWLCREHRPKKPHHLSSEARIARGDVGRRGRKPNPLYANIPKTATCKTCGGIVTLTAPNVLHKAQVLGVTVEELIANYKCRKCGGKITKADKLAAKKREKAAKKVAKVK